MKFIKFQDDWTINDVQDKFKCSDEQAQKVLDKALTNEATIEQIQYSIKEKQFFKNKKIQLSVIFTICLCIFDTN